MSNRSTARIETTKTVAHTRRRNAGQAEALFQGAASNTNHGSKRGGQVLSAVEAPFGDDGDERRFDARLVGEQDEDGLPPLHSKTNPRTAMHDALLTFDDEARGHHQHHPSDNGAVEFLFDPREADAAADLAGELSSQFLQGATWGEDLSSRVWSEEERLEAEGSFFIEDELEDEAEPLEEMDQEPSKSGVRLVDPEARGAGGTSKASIRRGASIHRRAP